MPKTYTVKEVAEILGYSTNSIYTFLKEKRIKGVRVGRGRFRIPQAELDRLLLINKSGQTTPALPATDTDTLLTQLVKELRNGVREPAGPSLVSPVAGLDTTHLHLPNFCDWFLGICSIVFGASLVLFNRTTETTVSRLLLQFTPALQALFIAGGLGLLLSDVISKRMRFWHFIFHGLVILGFVGYAVGLVTIGDIEGGFFFGSIGLASGIGSLFAMGGLGNFTLVLFLIMAVIGPAALLFFPADPHVAWAFQGMPVSFYLFWVVGGIVGGVAMVAAYHKSQRLYFLLVALDSAVFIGLSLWFARENFWPRAFFLLILGVTGLLSQVWRGLNFTHQTDRRAAFGLFGVILLLFLLAVGAVAVFQANMREYAKGNLAQKQAFGSEFIKGAVEQTKLTLESAAGNHELAEALKKQENSALTGFARSYFESNPYFYRVIFTNPAGDIIAYYPLSDAFTVTNLAFRDYFLQAVTRKSPVLSDVFEAVTQSKSKRVAYAVPVLDKKKEVVGVILGGISLERLGAKLQEIADEKVGEYFVVVGRTGSRIIHPESSLIGQPLEKTHPLASGVAAPAVAQAYTYGEKLALMAYGPLEEFGWTVAIQAPINGILRSTSVSSIVVFVLVGISMVLITGFSLFRQPPRSRISVPDKAQTPVSFKPTQVKRGFSDTS